jgi:hypothetical protein
MHWFTLTITSERFVVMSRGLRISAR